MQFRSRIRFGSKNRSLFFATLFLIPILLLFFQNCSSSLDHLFNHDDSSSASKQEMGGNGEPYDGKPSHLRLVPGVSCGVNAAIGQLAVHGSTATVIKTEQACEQVASEVPVNKLEFSTFSDKFIAYEEGVYTYLENPNKNISEGIFTEAWCRAMNSDRSASLLEFAVEWRDQGAVANVSILSQKQPAPTGLASQRHLEVDHVSYTNAQGMLKINLKQKIPGTYKVAGAYYTRTNEPSPKPINVECLMGGQFDPVAPQFKYSDSTTKTLSLGENLQGLVPQVNKSTVQFSLQGQLPLGLSFDSKNGSISGRAQQVMPRQKFLVSAIFPFGQISHEISIGVGNTQVVDQNLDSPNSNHCVNGSGGCSLNQAIAMANALAPIPLIIKLRRPLTTLSGKSLTITGDVLIDGDSLSKPTVIDANFLSNHFYVAPGANLQLNNLQLINGRNFFGGSIQVNAGVFVAKDILFEKNETISVNGLNGNGGAIYADNGQIEILNSKFNLNVAPMNGSGGGGGAIYIRRPISSSIKNSTFVNNTAQNGGALYVFSDEVDTLQIESSYFSGNLAMRGGAIYAHFADLSVLNTTFTDNVSYFDGGAIGFESSSNSWITGSIFESNKGGGFGSAAIYWQGRDPWTDRGIVSALYILDSKFIDQSSTTPQAGVILNAGTDVILGGNQITKLNTTISCTKFAGATFHSIGGNKYDDQSCPP